MTSEREGRRLRAFTNQPLIEVHPEEESNIALELRVVLSL
jgi:hypothetical protein